MSRSIKIFNTQSSAKNNIESNATVWGDLVRDLENAGISTSGLKAVVGETEVTLESDGAQLPQNDFTLFMIPGKVRSGWEDDEEFSVDFDEGDEDGDEEDDEEDEGAIAPSFSKEQLIQNIERMRQFAMAILDLSETSLNGIRLLNANLDPETRKLMDKAEELSRKLFR